MILDLFAGPGGWDLAAIGLGMDPLGVEWDDHACATRQAVNLKTLQGDVGQLNPYEFVPTEGLIASPPCQAFSMAGHGTGRAAIATYRQAIEDWTHGQYWDTEQLDDACSDPRAHLVLEPLRWAGILRPQWIALEQVEPVLPLWEATATALQQRLGYHDAEQSGSQQANAIRITEPEAAILQDFPPDYPWQGNKSQRFRQIGNAIPPRLAHAILQEATRTDG